jgi:2-dehydro-3-deoxygluconokinase
MKTLCFGEIMLRLTPPNELRLVQANSFDAVYGGSEANVAVALSQLGLPTEYVSRVPDSDLGRAALGALSRYNVDTRMSVFGGERLGLYFLEMGAGRRGSKIIYDRQGSGMATLQPGMIDWRKVMEDVAWLHWSGITPALSQGAADTVFEALKVAQDMRVKVSCDLNYREKLWQYGKTPAQIMPNLVAYCDVMLGDRTAFELYFGIREQEDLALFQAVQQRFTNMQAIAMTSREGISASHNTYKGILFDGQQVYHSRHYELPDMLDRIGGGDAFMAGLIYGLRKALGDPQDAIEFAAAAAAIKHYVRGDFNICSEQEVRALIAGNTGGRVNR